VADTVPTAVPELGHLFSAHIYEYTLKQTLTVSLHG